jgi:hypothetical protein
VVHLGLLVISDPVEDKLHRKHNITFDKVKEAIQWPAEARAAWEDHLVYGRRLVAVGVVASRRRVLCNAQILIQFQTGLQLAPGHAYKWRVRIDGVTQDEWTELLYVPTAATGPVVG